MIAIEAGKDSGDLEDVDYSESIEVLNDQEQRDKWEWELSKGLIDLADILMQQNPDLTREEAEAELELRKKEEEVKEDAGSALLQALERPVE